MVKIEMRLNGRKITSGSQLKRQLRKSIERNVEKTLQQKAGPTVRIEKTGEGFIATGPAESIQRLRERLKG